MKMEEKEGYFKILSRIARREEPEDYGLPLIRNAEPVPLSAENFHTIDAMNKNLRIGFVDGGNNLIFLSPGQAIHLVRLYYSIFESGKKIEGKRYTFIVDSRFEPQNNYYARVFDLDEAGIYEGEMKIDEGEIEEREKIKGIGAYLRRIGEWLIMERIMDKCDLVVRDGSLQTTQKGEYKYADRIFERVNKKIVGLSKTCSLLTTKGYSLIASIHHLSYRNGIKAPWYYNPIAKNITTIKGDMFVVKLHSHSSYVFRCEVYPEDDADEIFSALTTISKDPIFLGYPYGLIDADINARISEEEAKMYRMILYDNANNFSRLESNAMNAHDIISEVR